MRPAKGPDFGMVKLAEKELHGIIILTQNRFTKADVAIRLTASATKKFLEHIQEAVERNIGVSFVIQDLKSAVGLIETEKGSEIKFAGYTDSDKIATSAMKGYRGRWSHIEIFLPFNGNFLQLQKFIEDVKAKIDLAEKDSDQGAITPGHEENQEEEVPY